QAQPPSGGPRRRSLRCSIVLLVPAPRPAVMEERQHAPALQEQADVGALLRCLPPPFLLDLPGVVELLDPLPPAALTRDGGRQAVGAGAHLDRARQAKRLQRRAPLPGHGSYSSSAWRRSGSRCHGSTSTTRATGEWPKRTLRW